MKFKTICSLLFVASNLSAFDIELYYEPRPPFVDETSNTLEGIVATPLLNALQKANISYELKNVPSKRHLHDIESNQKSICAIGWFKNSDREKFAKFSKPIYTDKPMGIVARKDDMQFNGIKNIESLLANANLILLTKASYSYGKFIDEKIVALQTKKREVSTDNLTMLSMIEKKRGDYAFMSFEEADELLRQSQSLRFADIADMPKGNSRYLICSQKVDDKLLNQLNQYIE